MRVIVDGKATYKGKTLAEWVPVIVEELARTFDPVRIILFGSVARGDDGPDSDIDLMVVLSSIDAERRHEIMAAMRRTISVPLAVEIYPTDPVEVDRRKNIIGSMHYRPLREGEVVYERAA